MYELTLPQLILTVLKSPPVIFIAVCFVAYASLVSYVVSYRKRPKQKRPLFKKEAESAPPKAEKEKPKERPSLEETSVEVEGEEKAAQKSSARRFRLPKRRS